MSNETENQSAAPAEAAPCATEPLTPEEITELQAQAAKADEHRDRHLRLAADFENFKKRAARERDEAVRLGVERVVTRLLPLADNFEMAMLAANAAGAAPDSLKAGVAMIQSQLKAVLGEFGIEEVDAQGKTFDPSLHEAVSQLETADAPEGQVVQQLRKGYRLRERLLRPASVVVAKKPAA
ncbi:MAG: nucleotide exchange factor GrpE [Verrucomicrobia bacterium]|nr:nucleotide exchange factor GrpE [Verrucomicrobiota bacterium]